MGSTQRANTRNNQFPTDNLSTNTFMNLVLNKKKKKKIISYWLYNRKIKKFLKGLEKASLDFGTLWRMADFIKVAELVFMYPNSTAPNPICSLYSSTGYAPGENGFRITNEDCRITIKLYVDDDKVGVEVERLKSTEFPKTTFKFINGNWVNKPSAYDEMILEFVERRIISEITKLFRWCYNNW